MQDPSLSVTLTSAQMQEVYRLVEDVARTKATVVITGKTGVGKEIIANKIHQNSPRKLKPFKVVNCSAFSNNGLLQSELFGHEKGAFTDATYQRDGMFEQADMGTLFLDEVGEMSSEVQAMFLRTLETQEFTRLGGNQTIKTDVRVIAATNKCLETAVKNKQFREDLYYRLNRFHIHIPPLCERREDIPLLIDAFIDELSNEHGKQITGITWKARICLESAAWPGNIRQLKNALASAIITTRNEEIGLADLPADLGIIQHETQSEEAPDLISDTAVPTETLEILARISVKEFIMIFGAVPNAVWRELPEKSQHTIIRDASFRLSELLGGHQGAIRIESMDRDQILGEVARLRLKQYGSATKAAASLGIDRRTLKTYAEVDRESSR